MVQIFTTYAQYIASWEGHTADFKGHGFRWNPAVKAWEGTLEQAKALLEELELDVDSIRRWCQGRSSIRAQKGREVAGTLSQVARIVKAAIAEHEPQPEPKKASSKRSWSREEKQAIVAEYRAAARGTKKGVLEAHKISRSYIYRWEAAEAIHRAGWKAREAVAKARRIREQQEADEQARLEEIATLQDMKDRGFKLNPAALAKLAAA